MPKLWVNDVDVATLYGLWIDTPTGFGDAAESRDTVIPVSGQAGGLVDLEDAQVSPRRITVTGHIIAATADLARSQWEALKLLLAGPELELKSDAWPGRIAMARYERVTWLRRGDHQDAADFRLDFVVPNPYLVAAQFEVHMVGSDRPRAIPLGSAPSPVDLRLYGSAGINPRIIYYDAQGRERGRVGFTLTLAVGEWIEVDGSTGIALLHTSSGAVVANAARYLSLDTELFVADPADGDAAGGPLLFAQNCVGAAYVRKAYR
jgi:hypothetical protein